MVRLLSSRLLGSLGVVVLQPLMLQGAPPAAAEVALRQPQMRVLVAEAAELLVRADGAERLMVRGLGSGTLELSRLRVVQRGGQLLVEAPGLGPTRVAGSAGLSVHSRDPRGVWLGKRRYGGELRLMVREGRLQAVNHLGVESYLASVVGSEMPQEWPLAALQAQAIAARTYALRQRGRKGAFDVKATVASQVYRGLESATPRTREAVDSTRSLVMVHGGKLINAVFHSSSGGATEPSGEVWRHQLPYLVSVRDHDHQSPVHRWQQTFDRQQLRAAFRETGGLQALDVLTVSTTGRLRSVRVRGPGGALVLSGRELRQRLGLKSTMVSFNWLAAGSSQGAIRSLQRQVPRPSSPKQQDQELLVGTWRDSASGSRRPPADIAPSAFDADSAFAPLGLIKPPPPPAPGAVHLGSRRDMVLMVRGQGYGHGVGMSQWGARGLAEQGADFRQILEHYYQGVTIRPFLPVDDPAMASTPIVRPAWSC